jgi:hypothetical protein
LHRTESILTPELGVDVKVVPGDPLEPFLGLEVIILSVWSLKCDKDQLRLTNTKMLKTWRFAFGPVRQAASREIIPLW